MKLPEIGKFQGIDAKINALPASGRGVRGEGGWGYVKT